VPSADGTTKKPCGLLIIFFRDLALRNVLATTKGEGKYLVKVSDFGMRFDLSNTYN
jgi:hypothetical protein